MDLPIFRKTYPSQLGDRDDEFFMKYAFNQAVEAFDAEEVPVGAVIVRGDELIGAAHNEVNRTNDPTAHAEVIALRQAAKYFWGLAPQ
ncbi:MAG: deaminase [Opitutales bacterium]|nr:deaminase [Opitutales bacterium]